MQAFLHALSKAPTSLTNALRQSKKMYNHAIQQVTEANNFGDSLRWIEHVDRNSQLRTDLTWPCHILSRSFRLLAFRHQTPSVS